MKLKDLIESVAEATKTKRKTSIHKIKSRPRFPFTRLVLKIYESNVKYNLDEAIAYMPKSFRGKSGNRFDYKMEIMMEYLNEATIELDNYVKRMPNLMDLDKIHFSSNLKDLVKELNKVIRRVHDNYQYEMNILKISLSQVIERKTLTLRKISDFNQRYKELINEVDTFNEMIDYLNKLFNTKVKGKDTKTILYNPNELKYKRLINSTLNYKIIHMNIEIPQEPIDIPDDIDEGLFIRPEDREEA